jgi:hypothetical protein
VLSNRCPQSLFALAKPWLAGLLALLWVLLFAESVGHHCESGRAAHPDCAACQMAHGTLLANGCTEAVLEVASTEVAFQSVWILPTFASTDFRLSPGRAPPA